jgi:hypothetical protein
MDFQLPPSIPSEKRWDPPEDIHSNTSSSANEDSDSFDEEAEALLLGDDERPSLYIKPHHRPFRDVIFIFLYGICMLTMLVIGFVETMTIVPSISYGKSIFLALWSTAGKFPLVSCFWCNQC